MIKKYPLSYNPIKDYYSQIASGEIIVCQKIRRLYEKLNYDLADSSGEYEYRPKRANHAIEFIENFCRHSKGKWGGKPVILELWQKAAIAALFGFVHKIDGTRKYQEALLIVARKNGKSTLAAAIGLYLMIADGEPGAEIYAVATKYDQAKIIWLEAKRMVKKSPTLYQSRENPEGKIKPLVAELVGEFNESSFKPLGSDSDSLDGLNVHGALLDEIHAWKDKNLYDVIVDGVSSREQPLIFESTTAGTIRGGVYDLLYAEAEQIINGYGDPKGYKNERFLPLIYELDKRDEWMKPDCWVKANPGLGTIKKYDTLAGKVKKAMANPMLVKNLVCKDFNVRETTCEAWLTFEQLNNTTKFDIEVLKPRYGVGGADLSTAVDLTAAKVLFMVPSDDHIYVLQMYWMPEDCVELRTNEDHVPYDKWVELGYIRTCPGNKIHAKYVTQWFVEVQEKYDLCIPWTGYDAWSATYWVEEMRGYFGAESMIAVRQGAKTLSVPMKQLGADLESKLIVYNDNPVDKWCLANTAKEEDGNGNIKPHKTTEPRKRIDGTAALLDAYTVLQDKMEEYQTMI